MNAATIKGKSRQLNGQVKKAFGKLTADDLTEAEGDAMKLVGSIQARYGYTQARAQKAWDAFMSGIDDAEERVAETAHDVGATARKGWRRVSTGVDDAAHVAADKAHDVGDTARKAWDRASTGVEDAAHAAADKAHDVGARIDKATAPYRPSGRHAGLKSVAVVAALVAVVVVGRWVLTTCGVLLRGASTSGDNRNASARR